MKKTKGGLKEKKFYTTCEAGDMLFVSHSTVIEWIKAGRIKATKTLGGHRRIPRDELHSFIRRNRMEFAGTKQARILVTDDDETIRAGLKETLESRGFEVYAAADGFEAGIMGFVTLDAQSNQNRPSCARGAFE